MMSSDHAEADAQPTQSEADLRAKVRKIVMELSPNLPAVIPPEGRLVDHLGYHSLALLELAFALEDAFELSPIDEKTARKIVTMGDVEQHVVSELRSAGRVASS